MSATISPQHAAESSDDPTVRADAELREAAIARLKRKRKFVEDARTSVEELDRELGDRHAGQEQRYTELLRAHHDAQAQAREELANHLSRLVFASNAGS